ncbi:hypothetical protein VYU27_009681 [Nannochloropsis oceanica]
MTAVKQLGELTMCRKNTDGMRSWACYDRTCPECKDKLYIEGCPVQHSESGITKWFKKVRKAMEARASGADGTVEGGNKRCAGWMSSTQTTLLPVVVWFLAPTGRARKLKMQQHSRVYLSTDRRHSNNLVQNMLDNSLAHLKEVTREPAAGVEECAMRRLSVWSDWCKGHFKKG